MSGIRAGTVASMSVELNKLLIKCGDSHIHEAQQESLSLKFCVLFGKMPSAF